MVKFSQGLRPPADEFTECLVTFEGDAGDKGVLAVFERWEAEAVRQHLFVDDVDALADLVADRNIPRAFCQEEIPIYRRTAKECSVRANWEVYNRSLPVAPLQKR